MVAIAFVYRTTTYSTQKYWFVKASNEPAIKKTKNNRNILKYVFFIICSNTKQSKEQTTNTNVSEARCCFKPSPIRIQLHSKEQIYTVKVLNFHHHHQCLSIFVFFSSSSVAVYYSNRWQRFRHPFFYVYYYMYIYAVDTMRCELENHLNSNNNALRKQIQQQQQQPNAYLKQSARSFVFVRLQKYTFHSVLYCCCLGLLLLNSYGICICARVLHIYILYYVLYIHNALRALCFMVASIWSCFFCYWMYSVHFSAK